MCQFLSAIVSKNKEFYCNPFIDSHSELEVFFKIKDNAVNYFAGNFVKVEYTPKDNNYGDLDSYSLKIDENVVPGWCDDDFKLWIKNKMHDKILSIYHKDETLEYFIGDVGIFENCNISNVNYSRILSFRGGTLEDFRGGTLNNFWGGTLEDFRGGTLEDFRGGTLNNFWGGTLKDFWGGTLKDFWGGTLNNFRGGTLNNFRGGTLNNFRGGTLEDLIKAKFKNDYTKS